jgi:hypothetical protein
MPVMPYTTLFRSFLIDEEESRIEFVVPYDQHSLAIGRREPSNRAEDKGGVLAEYGLSEEQGNEIIMAARAHWFEDETSAPESGEDAVAESPE